MIKKADKFLEGYVRSSEVTTESFAERFTFGWTDHLLPALLAQNQHNYGVSLMKVPDRALL